MNKGDEFMKKGIVGCLKIKSLLLFAIILLSLVPLTISAIASSMILKKNNEKTFIERGNTLNRIVENTIVNRISQYEQLLLSIAENGEFDSEEYINDGIIDDMNIIQNSNDQIINVYFAKDDGRFIQTSDEELPEGFDCRERSWFIEGMNNPEKRRIERPYVDTLSKELVTTVYKTVNKNNKVYGILAMDVKLSDLSNSLSMIKFGENSELVVADPENSMVVFCGDESKVGQDEPSQYSTWEKIKNDESGFTCIHHEEIEYKAVYTTSSILDWKIILKEPTKDLNAAIFNVILNNVVNICIVSVIALSMAFIFARKMGDMVIELNNNIETASKGNFNIEISKKTMIYEFSSLIDSFNEMLKNVSGLMINVDNSIEDVNRNSDEAFEISKQISESIGQVSETITQISQGNIECSDNLEDISAQISDLSNSMNNINAETEGADKLSKKTDDLSTYGTKMINEIKEKSAVTKLNSDEVKAVVYDVSESVESISNMNATISNIASQTNLLALNAAIEAARAGESGRGFAVVADEIVKLADETGKSAKQIELMVNAIKDKTKSAVDKVNETAELVTSQEEAIEQSCEVFDGISDSIKELTEKITVIRDEVISVNSLKDVVLDRVENLSAIFEETAAGSEEVTASAEEVATTTETFVEQFNNLKDTVDNLNKEISKFDFK